ncbi:VCBS repeat-containing protein [bacterium]|nr:VCBS repeat-containing protein [bacterium]
MSPDKTGVKFVNQVDEWEASQNRVLYNGAGVAVGDYDRDGWPDIFLCAIDGNSVLYKNNGNWTFADAASSSGLKELGHRHRGAVFADLNGDDWLDLLVGTVDRGIRTFINQRGVFQEMSQASGLAGVYAPMTMALADVDSNGTLDLYVTNNRPSDIRDEGSITLRRVGGKLVIPAQYRNRLVVSGGIVKEYGEADFLFLNDGKAVFSKSSWTEGSFLTPKGEPLSDAPLDWGLSAAFHDINHDGLPDLYVCNDFWTPDRFWINQGGVFNLLDPKNLSKTSASSMGVDFSDYDRDGDVDLFVVDMLSRDLAMRKRQAPAQDLSDRLVNQGEYADQVMRNTLLNNRGDGSFAELANMAGLTASDWSWSPVFLDVDLDGYEDLIITAGHYKDTQDLDVNALIQTRQKPRDRSLSPKQRKLMFSREMMDNNRLYPGLDLPIITFRNGGSGTFEEMTLQWGTDDKGIHHGMALADLDLDGDMDLVVNNMNQEPGLYENRFMAPRVAVVLHGEPPNTQAIGSKVLLTGGAVVEQTKEIVSGGRFLSGSETKVVFGTGSRSNKMSLIVEWRSGKTSVIDQVKGNHLYHVHERGASESKKNKAPLPSSSMFVDLSESIYHVHVENVFDDFAKQPLLPFKLSQAGPAACVYDINADHWDDLIVGCSAGGRLHVFLNDQNGGFRQLPGSQIAQDDVASIFSLGTGKGNEFFTINYGYESTGGVMLTRHQLVEEKILSDNVMNIPIKSVGAVAQADIDGDGDLDLFLGGGVYPGKYPESSKSAIYLCDGTQFAPDISNAKTLLGLGIVNGPVWSDLDADGYPELITAGHWQPVRIFKNEKGILKNVTKEMGLEGFTGLWNSVQVGDINGDGRMDLVAGNWGLNSPYKSTSEKPLNLVFGDINQDGTNELIESDYNAGVLVPVRTFKDLTAPMPFLYSRFKSFRQFSRASVAQVIGDTQTKARLLSVQTLHSCVFINEGNRFRMVKLPSAAQWAPTHGIVVDDFDGDGFEDLFLAQNFFSTRVQGERLDASRGVLLKGQGTENFTVLESGQSGINLVGDQRAAVSADFDRDGMSDLVVTRNSGKTALFLNEAKKIGLRVVVQGAAGNTHGIGSVLRLKYHDGMGPARQITGSSGYRSQGSSIQVLHATRPVEAVWIQKPDGQILTHEIKKGTHEVRITY